jgi:hypothetical protein
MVQKKYVRGTLVVTCFIYIMLLITSCQQDRKQQQSAVEPKHLEILRFERDLFSEASGGMNSHLEAMRSEYGSFFDLFAFQITRLGSPDTVQMNERFSSFLKDTSFRSVYNQCELVFGDFSKEKTELENAFGHYAAIFPAKIIPKVVTMVSLFSYPVVVDSTTLGIGLDMYLGTDYPYYSTLEPPLPMYLRDRMRKEYLPSDAMRGWLESDYGIDESKAKIIEMMISQGRILCALGEMMPEASDSILSGYTSGQLSWCRENEAKIWSFFIDNQLLFSDDPNLLQKYTGEGPTTNGFPRQSPGNIGKFTGWQIVRYYLKNHPEQSISSLLEEKDLMKIFRESKYKPAR